MVIHSHVVAHQVFAIRLVTWLDSILSHSEGFRTIFSQILTEQELGSNGRKQPSLLEGILKHDTDLWKAARSAVHHLLISGQAGVRYLVSLKLRQHKQSVAILRR